MIVSFEEALISDTKGVETRPELQQGKGRRKSINLGNQHMENQTVDIVDESLLNIRSKSLLNA